MNSKKITIISIILGVVLGIASVALFVSTFMGIKDNASTFFAIEFIAGICLIITCLFGIYYVFAGCKKEEGAKYYVCFMGAQAVCDLVAMAAAKEYPAACTMLLAAAIASCTVLCFAKDLGQKKSLTFASMNLAAQIAIFICLRIFNGAFTVEAGAALLLAATGFVMVCAKYYDKHVRGSK